MIDGKKLFWMVDKKTFDKALPLDSLERVIGEIESHANLIHEEGLSDTIKASDLSEYAYRILILLQSTSTFINIEEIKVYNE